MKVIGSKVKLDWKKLSGERMYDLGLLLRELRDKKGYSQKQLANKFHKDRTTISRYENNEKTPSLSTLTDYATLFNVSLDYLTGIDKKKSIVVDGLPDTQIALLEIIIEDLKDKNKVHKKGLSKRQQEILNLLMIEFNS